ncbi:hypothetical protein [Chitinophaga sp. S165]|uniref:hypothetical protein n=1 Tax=Chitinophaga sp. S165 TaxID=2135462 RepID=UPI000D7184D6|nr:hypothetical protein [Chitinophaga sp. S165]PWV57131.1 hypothetical protein C7475_1011652 [Chitinophaga sp. S165]
MKYKLALLLTFALQAITRPIIAQSIQEALRYSSDISTGSSRGQAVGGAVGALGGEVAAIYVNPAAAGFFRNSDLSISIGYQHISNTNYYLGNKGISKRGGPKFDDFTIVMRNKTKEHPLVFAMGVNRLNNFRENVTYQGNIANSSQSLNYFMQADNANITNPDLLLSPDENVTLRHTASLAYATYLINPYAIGGLYKFTSAAEADDNSILVNQYHKTLTRGGTTELSLVFGQQHNDKLSLGGSLNMGFISEDIQDIWKETNINPVHADLNYFQVTKTTKINGIGVSVKFGGIYKPIVPLNLGLSLKSPTWYGVNKKYQTDMVTDTKSAGVVTASTIYMIDDTTQSEADYLDYSLRTPWKATASAVLLFNTAGSPNLPYGFISADYELSDYRSMKVKYGDGLNNRRYSEQVKAAYQTVGNLRVGAEVKYLLYALRLGYAHYGNPYKTSLIDGSRTYYSGGVGYKSNSGCYIDLSLITGGNQKRREIPFEMLPNKYGYVNPPEAQVTSSSTRVSATFGVKF